MHINIFPPSPSAWLEETITDFQRGMSSTSSLSVIQTVIDLTTLVFVAAIVLLSLLSMYFIFHLGIKSKHAPYLQSFNSLGVIRFLLVCFVSLWGLVEVLRVPFFRHRDRYPFLPSLTVKQQADLCRVHIVLSLGLFEPGFLTSLLFLVTVSIKKKTPNGGWGVLFIFLLCMPIFALQILLVAWSPFELSLPENFRRSSVVVSDNMGSDMVLCTNPLLGTIVFGAFGFAYALWFMFSSWKVWSLVINRGLRRRIYWLVFTVLLTLPLQMLFLGISEIWKPNKVVIYGGLGFLEFLCTFICAVVAEGILVIKPILDSLSVGGPCCLLIPSSGRCLEEGRSPLEEGNS